VTNYSDEDALAKRRADACVPDASEYLALISDATAKAKVQGMVKNISSYFTLASIVTIGSTQFALYSLLYQEQDLRVRPIQRNFTAD
jgi:hypothetical protein